MPVSRQLLGAVAAATLAVTVAGCNASAPPEAEPTPSPASTSPSAEPEVDLSVAVYGDATRMRTYRRIAAAFMDEHPQVTVTLVRRADALEAVQEARTALELGAGPDVLLTDQRFLPQLVESGGLQPVDRLLEARGLQFGDDYQRVAMTSMSARDRLQCMPAEMSPRVVFYNRDLVPRRQLAAREVVVPNRVEPSWTWEDFETTVRTVAGLDQLGAIKGVYLPAEIGTLTALVRSGDGHMVDDTFDPQTLSLVSDEALEAIGKIVGLARDPAVSLTKKDLASRDAMTWFTDGDLGMYVGTRDDLPALRAADGLDFDVAPLPSLGHASSTSSVNGYCINAATPALDAAVDFVAFAVGPEAADLMAASDTMVPARVGTLSEDVFRQPEEEPRNSQVFAASMRRSEPMPYDVAWPRVAALVEDTFNRLFLGARFDPETELEKRLEKLDEKSRTFFADG